MRTFIEYFSDIVSFDAERDFYAKVFPDTVGENGMIRIRPMKKSDLKAVFAIEQEVYEFPWSEAVFRDCLKVGYSCWICENVRDVIAYGIVSVVGGESHIMNICVSPKAQNKGYGRKMLEKLIEVA
ncbi:MAG: GNAT family N-acetyltransferase, partial [Pseudomonadota bacterium]